MKNYLFSSVFLLFTISCTTYNDKKIEEKIRHDSIINAKYEFALLLNKVDSNLKRLKYSESITYIDSCIQIEPQLAFLYNIKGCCLIYQGDINDKINNKKAIDCFSQAIKIDSNNPKYYRNRGWSYQFTHNYTSAVNDFKCAARLSPDSVIYFNDILRIHFIENNYKYALKLCDSLIIEFPENAYAFHVRGNIKRNFLGKYLEGNQDIKKSKELCWRHDSPFKY